MSLKAVIRASRLGFDPSGDGGWRRRKRRRRKSPICVKALVIVSYGAAAQKESTFFTQFFARILNLQSD